VFTKLYRFRIKIRLKFQNEYFLDYFKLSVQENLIYVSIDMVNVVLDIKCIRLKYMLVANLKFTFSFIKKLRIPRCLIWRAYFI